MKKLHKIFEYNARFIFRNSILKAKRIHIIFSNYPNLINSLVHFNVYTMSDANVNAGHWTFQHVSLRSVLSYFKWNFIFFKERNALNVQTGWRLLLPSVVVKGNHQIMLCDEFHYLEIVYESLPTCSCHIIFHLALMLNNSIAFIFCPFFSPPKSNNEHL